MSDDIDPETERLFFEGEHTPTPWGINGFGEDSAHIVTARYSPGAAWGTENRLATVDKGDPDCERSRAMALKNAAHIVKCVNERDAMLKAMKDLLEEAEEILGEFNGDRENAGWDAWGDSDTPAMVRARVFIAQTEEGADCST